MIRRAAASSGASKTAMPVLVRPSVGPTSTMTPSAISRWSRSKWTAQTAFSSGVIVAAKSSRGGWMK
jgi:hypothetical protein